MPDGVSLSTLGHWIFGNSIFPISMMSSDYLDPTIGVDRDGKYWMFMKLIRLTSDVTLGER